MRAAVVGACAVGARAARQLAVPGGVAAGLSCLLAARAARSFEEVEEIHVGKVGTGGQACARQHHVALRGPAVESTNGTWQRRRGQSGRALIWFPDPIGGVDCYRAALPEPVILADAFPKAARITAR